MKEKHILILQIVIVILMLFALNPGNPYSYYIMLRFVSFGAFAYLAYLSVKKKQYIWALIFAFWAIRYNPFMPFYTSRSNWAFYNIAAAITTGASIFERFFERLGSAIRYKTVNGKQRTSNTYPFSDLIDTINKTRMQKSYKMGLMLSFVKDNNIKRRLSLEELARDFRKTYAQEPYSLDLTEPGNRDMQYWSLKRVISFIKKNPIEHLEAPFFLKDGYFELRLEEKCFEDPEYAHRMRLAITSRVEEYFSVRN